MRVFIVNLEQVVSDQPVTGAVAAKVLGSNPRYLWYLAANYDLIVLAETPPPEFVAYLESFGLTPNFYVPRTLNRDALSILDGFRDPELLQLITGAVVESYVPSQQLAKLVIACGGTYLPCDNDRVTASSGDKANFANLAAGAVQVPPGQTATGSRAIARLIRRRRFLYGKRSFVRYVRAGGGLGNRVTPASWWWYLSLRRIITFLEANDSGLWREATAQVEDVLNLTHTFGVAFDVPGSVEHSTLQITRDSSFYGCWIPCPPWICSPDRLAQIAWHFSVQLKLANYWGKAQVDLASTNKHLEEFGFEINARLTGGHHMRFIGELLCGPYRLWAKRGIVIRGVDVVHLLVGLSFSELHGILNKAALLATPEHPWGAVISIPPGGTLSDPTVGLVIISQGDNRDGYHAAEAMYRQIIQLVGHPTRNQEDRPLIPVHK